MDGDLVAKLTPAQRVDMIQKGYLPGREEDVERYLSNRKPTGEAMALAIQDTGDGYNFNVMGESKMSYTKDYAAIRETLGEGVDLGDLDLRETPSRPITRESLGERMKGYSHSGREIDLNSSLQNIVQKKQIPQQRSVLTETQTGNEEELGYKVGVKYLNAFIRLLKESSVENRNNLVQAVNVLTKTESQINPQALSKFRRGLQTAESKVYNQIKGIK